MKKAVIISIISAILLAALVLCGLWLFPKGESEQMPPFEPLPEPAYYREGYYIDPPKISLTCGNSTLKPSTWCTGWETYSADGNISVFHATYPHPMSNDAHHKTFVLEKNTVHFVFSAPPESVSVVRWPKSEIGKSNDAAKSEPIPHEMTAPDQGTLTAEKGYLYRITGRWKGGGVDYYFFTE